MSDAASRGIFVLPYKTGFLVYAPLAGRIVHANRECVAELREYLRTHDSGTVQPEVMKRLGGLQWLETPVKPESLPVDRLYHPTTVTLFLTNQCNLRCRYCYARSGDFMARDMQPALYQSAIDLVARNARRAGRRPRVGFHGGGEPTMAWEALTGAVEHARRQAPGNGHPGVEFSIATNGVMSPSRREYVATTFGTVTLSLDGPSDIQNAMRPCADGSGSFDEVMAFIEVLRRQRTQFVIRSTITAHNVHRLSEMVDFLSRQTGCKHLHFEPAFLSGRCCNLESGIPDPEDFAREFIQAMDRARPLGVQVRFSAARLMGAFLSFCGCAQDPFNVTPEGDITACFEVCDSGNPLAATYHFGRFEPDTRRFVVDPPRLARLRAMTVDHKPLCQRCFARWNCSGDCPVKTHQPFALADAESPRCRMIQTITRALLERAVETAPCPAN